jgi:hypothetical protein
MKSFYEKDNYTISDIQSLIQNEVEESIHLEFKEARALGKTEDCRKEIAKDISAFANSDGGIIIYGIKEENHKANSITFINGNDYSKEWLEQIINSTIQRHIPDIEIFPIRDNGDIDKSIYLLKIPKSIEAPHISKDKRFYKRFNFQSVMMEEYEIRQLYGRRIKSKLQIDNFSIRLLKADESERKIECEVTITNIGDIFESLYKVNVYFIVQEKENPNLSIQWEQIKTNYDYVRIGDRFKISVIGQAPIFPNETVNVIRFTLTIANEDLLQDHENIEVLLLYSNGEDRLKGNLKDLLKKIPPPNNESYNDEF